MTSPISARAAAGILRDLGLTREQARVLLHTGIAGAAMETTGALLYDEIRVRELAAQPVIERAVLAEHCPYGVFLGRLSPARRVDLTLDPQARRRQVSGPWSMNGPLRVLISAAAERGAPMPFVATMCGIAVVSADILGVCWAEPVEPAAAARQRPAVWRLDLAAPTGDHGGVVGHRLDFARGGAAFRLFAENPRQILPPPREPGDRAAQSPEVGASAPRTARTEAW